MSRCEVIVLLINCSRTFQKHSDHYTCLTSYTTLQSLLTSPGLYLIYFNPNQLSNPIHKSLVTYDVPYSRPLKPNPGLRSNRNPTPIIKYVSSNPPNRTPPPNPLLPASTHPNHPAPHFSLSRIPRLPSPLPQHPEMARLQNLPCGDRSFGE